MLLDGRRSIDLDIRVADTKKFYVLMLIIEEQEGKLLAYCFKIFSAIDAIATFRLITEDIGDYVPGQIFTGESFPVFWLCFKP